MSISSTAYKQSVSWKQHPLFVKFSSRTPMLRAPRCMMLRRSIFWVVCSYGCYWYSPIRQKWQNGGIQNAQRLWLCRLTICWLSNSSQRRMPLMYVILTNPEDLGDEGTYWLFPQHDEDVGRATGGTEIREDSYCIWVVFCSSPVTIHFYLLCYKIWYEFAGFSDPIYAEAYVKMHGFNIRLGEPSKGDTCYNLTFLRRHSTRQPNS